MDKKNNDTAIAELKLSVGTLARRLRNIARPDGLSMTHMSVMARLDKEGAATAADLARAEGVKPQSMGTIIAALEEEGFVARAPHETDGRQMNVILTAKGKAARKASQDARHTWLAQAVAALPREEQDTLFAAGKIIRKLGEQ